jgi:hypothetical protein
MAALTAAVAGGLVPAVTQAARADTAPVSLTASAVQDTASGTARTLDLPGGGYAVVHSFGEISVADAAGQTRWEADTQQLYEDWDVTWQQSNGFTEYPQLAWGGNPVNPLDFTGAADGLADDVTPAAAGVLDGAPVVAVAETVGSGVSGESFCLGCTQPFNVPGSSIHLGTFVSVFDARTGQMIYHELDNGYVTQLAIAGGRLIVGNETGDPSSSAGIGAWGSVSTVRALTLSPSGPGARGAGSHPAGSAEDTAHQAWEYSTHVPWGRLLALTVTDGGSRDPGVAVAWSDTPSGLGVPGPPDGHVLLLDEDTGATRWQVRTAGYPELAAADDQRGELAVVQLADPAQSVGYTMTGLRYSNGSTETSVPRPGSLPFSLAVGSGADDGWAVGSTDATMAGGYYTPSNGRVTLVSPATDRALWSVTLPSSSNYGAPEPGGVVVANGTVIVSSWLAPVQPTASTPVSEVDDIIALNYRTARTDWTYTGDTGDPLSLSAVTAGPGLARTVTSHQDVVTYGPGGRTAQSASAGTGDYLSGLAVPASEVAGSTSAASSDLIAGDEDGDVTALDGKTLSGGTEKTLWRAHLPGAVQDVTTGTLDGRPVIVAAATSAVGVLDASTGQLIRLIQTPGTYAYTATVISAGGTPAVVVPGASLTAYSLSSGAKLWGYAAPSGASFSDAAYAGGVVAAEYSSAMGNNGTAASQMAAVGLNAATGTVAWSAPANPSSVTRGELFNGAFASQDIAGAGGDGVALAWQSASGGGTQVDVRDIVTGALDYSDTSDDLGAFTQFLASPGTGLIGVAQAGSALITPSGAESSNYPYGLGGAFATTTSGRQALLTADASVNAYGTDIFTTSSPSVEAYATGYQSGSLVSGDFAGDGAQQAVALPVNWLAYQIVNGETGQFIMANLVTVQHGLAMITLQDGGSSSGTTQAPTAQAPLPGGSPTVPQAARYPVPAGTGTANGTESGGSSSGSSGAGPSPSGSSIPASTRPVGQKGSSIPVLEPGHSGTVAPGASPVTAKHTLTGHAADTAVTPPGYSPSQLRSYLGLTGDGQSQTIAIVDAYDDPDITSDAETFSQQYGLPGVCGAGGTAGDCFTLDVRQQSATAGSDGDWALETSMDVEWAHTIAPKATIELIEASDGTFASLFRGVATAAATHPAAVSMSWGYTGGEFSDETYYDHFCQVSTTVCVVSSGDDGHPGSYPAYNPAALAVGGTTLTLGSDGSVTSEQAWNGSGGGQSWVEPEPLYQDAVQSSGSRRMPDVSFDADPNTGVAVYDSVSYEGQSGWWEVGGTSLGAPSWSAILADTDQLRAADGKAPLTAAGFAAHKAVYSLPSPVLAPVTSGPSNGACPTGCTPSAGYDEITGMGSPRAGIDSALAAATG